MKKLPAILSLVAVSLMTAFLTGGCASYDIQPIAASTLKEWNNDKKSLPSGYIIYQPELYFSVSITETSQGQTLTVTPLFLPNYQKPYRITTHNFLGKADFAFTLTDGWKLTQLSDKSDNTTLANTLASQLKTILTAGGIADVKFAPGTAPKTRTILYRPVFDEKTGFFKSFDHVGVIADSSTIQ